MLLTERQIQAEERARATKTKTVKEVLLDAAALIEERGHVKYMFVDRETGAICMMAAIRGAAGLTPSPLHFLDSNPLLETVHETTRWDMIKICAFNNKHSKRQVVAKLRELAEK